MKKFYLLITLFLLLSNVGIVQAQISYTLKNSTQNRTSSFDLRLLHDNWPAPSDFNIIVDTVKVQSDASYFKLTITTSTYDSNGVVCINDSLVKALTGVDSINKSSAIWINSTANSLYLCNYGAVKYGQWQNVTNKYIGLRMYKPGVGYYYGYVQMSVTPQTAFQPTVIIIDFAYQQTAGKGIKAGQLAGMNHITLNSALYNLNDHQLRILSNKAENISISDISGHQLLNSDVRSNKSFDLSAYPNGIYLIRITTDNGILTNKIILR